MFNIFVTCLCVPMFSIPFPCMFFDLLITCIYLISDLLSFSSMLLVISCTCVPGPHHLIMYTCACYARHLALFYVLAGVANNPGFSCPDPGVWTIVLLYLIRVAQRERGLAVALSGPSFFQPPLDRLARFSSCYS